MIKISWYSKHFNVYLWPVGTKSFSLSLIFKRRKGTKVAAFLSTPDFKDIRWMYTSKLCSSIISSVFLYKQDPRVQIYLSSKWNNFYSIFPFLFMITLYAMERPKTLPPRRNTQLYIFSFLFSLQSLNT